MHTEDTIVYVNTLEIRDKLAACLKAGKTPYADLIAEAIVKNLDRTEVGMEQLFKSFSGIYPQAYYKEGDKVWAKISSLYSWRIKQEHNKDRIHKGLFIVEIIEVDLQRQKPYKVKYEHTDGTIVAFEEGCVGLSDLFLLDDYPMNL